MAESSGCNESYEDRLMRIATSLRLAGKWEEVAFVEEQARLIVRLENELADAYAEG
jgi:hypothetical protein